MAKINIPYRCYRFIDKDPITDALRTMIRSDEHLNNNQVHEISGVAAQTIHGWLDGATRRPQNASTSQVSAALGYVRRDYIDKRTGMLVISFVKDRELDWGAEIEKQTKWFLGHGGKGKKPKKRKANGGSK